MACGHLPTRSQAFFDVKFWASGFRGNDGNGKRNGKRKRKHGKYCACSQVPSCTADLISSSSLFLLLFCLVRSYLGSRSIRWLVRFAHSFTQCLATKIISSDLLRGWMKTCCQSSNGSESLLPYTLIRVI